MAERGQITGGLLDGPLAFDNAISKEAAQIKGITSEVAGDPDILLAPDLEAGNILAKQLSFLANADSAGLVLGARVPIILTSRADSVRSRIASCAVAVLAAHARRQPAGRDGVGDDMDDYALVLNAGSSSLKFCVYRRPRARGLAARGARPDRGHRHVAAAVRRRTARARRWPTSSSTPRVRDGARRARRRSPAGCARATAARACSASATASSTAGRASPARRVVTPEVLDELRELMPLAPLHQPHNLAAIEAVSRAAARRAAGGLLRHQLPSRPAGGRRARAAAARASARAGVQRYGFHGLSYEYIASVLPRWRPRSPTGA